ncbi:MAG: class I SAM-dependent methyltransferase, partial [Epibacterium sp.]|nr:class I SAM-dependent methyltransferase [Epibacterium sp.]
LYKKDIEPKAEDVEQGDALSTVYYDVADFCITNPPWDRKFLHPFIEWYTTQMPTWLLFDADWMHTKQSAMYMTYCKKVVSVGRVKWIEGSKSVGKDNCCWYLFDYEYKGPTEFYGRLI